MRIDARFLRTRVGIALLAATIIILLWVALLALRPFPSRHLVMATGPPGDTYARFGESYRQILARNGVQVQLLPTNGAVENLQLLSGRHPRADVTFAQAGVVRNASDDLISLGTVFYEPVWFFCRCSRAPGSLREHLDWRISIGPVGSADRVVALELLALNGIDARQLHLFDYHPQQAARALIAGQLDALVLSTGWESPAVQQLAQAPDINFLGFPRADAYVRLIPTFNKLVLPRGVLNLGADRPPQDSPLIASKASLIVRRDLHPALQYLLLQAAVEIHSRPDMFQHAGEFPAAEEIDLPLSNDARRFYRSGPSFLQRSLPFWLAELVQRLLILIVPIAGVLYPLWSLVPKMYRWQMNRRVYRMYGELKALERELREATPDMRRHLIGKLDELDRRALNLRVPMSFSEGSYNLKSHIHELRAWALLESRSH